MTPSLIFPAWLEETLLWIGGVALVSVGVDIKDRLGYLFRHAAGVVSLYVLSILYNNKIN